MLVQFYPVRETTNKGGALVWRLLVQRFLYEGGATVSISALAGTTTLERNWTTARYGGATSALRTSGEYSGTVTDTVTFDATGGIVTYDITDKLSPVRSPDVVEVEARVNGVLYTTHGFTSGDVFTRGGALDGELVIQKLVQAGNTDDEEYLEDMINRGWNFSTLFRWVEELDGYVTDLRIPATNALGLHFVTINVGTLNTNLSSGDGQGWFTVPPWLNGKALRSVYAACSTASSSGIVTVQLANVTDGYDLLTTLLTLDVNEKTSTTAAIAAVIDTVSSHNVVSTDDLLRVDVDGAGTNVKNLQITLGFG